MPNPSPQTQPTMASPSKKRLLANSKRRHGACQNSAPDHMTYKDKITRELPNLSECHGCGLRIDYSNPKARLQPLDSVWRIVLLCKKCVKQVNSGQTCLYCFKDAVNSVSGCFNCCDCDRLVHKDCVIKYGNSIPWSYCSKEFKLGFSVCIDCWVPELLKSSIRDLRKDKNENGVGSKDDHGEKSLEEMVKDANCAVEKKIEVAAKAKEKALRKAVAARNAAQLACSVLDLDVEKDCKGKTGEGLVRNSKDKGNVATHVTRVVDDAELAFRLHRAMNSSPRISRNMCSVNLSRFDIYKKTDSNSISEKWIDLGSREGGMIGMGSNSKLKEDHDRSITEASAKVSNKESGSAVVSGRLRPVLKTYKRNNFKRKDHLENREAVNATTSVGIVARAINDDSRIVSEKFRPQDISNLDLHVRSAQAPCPEQYNGNVIRQEGSVNAKPDRYSVKYSKKISGSRGILHNDTSSSFVASQKENKASAAGLPVCCSTECSGSSDASLHSCVVNLQGCASVGSSSEEEG